MVKLDAIGRKPLRFPLDELAAARMHKAMSTGARDVERRPLKGSAFRSLATPNYRRWAIGALISNIGTWMQRTAQDWLVLTVLTHNNATAVGVVMGLQFGPQLLFLPITGYAADHWDRRKILLVTQTAMGLLAVGLGVLTLTGLVQLWQVFIFAFLLGSAAAFDAPARQTFVGELVGETNLTNAVALNATSFHAARMVGPAVAGLMMGAIGTGWMFVINGASYFAVILSLLSLERSQLHPHGRGPKGRGGLVQGFRYVKSRPDIVAMLVMLFLIGAFGLNFPIFISTMAVKVYGVGASHFGLLSSALAVGSVSGALLAARRERPRFTLLMLGAILFCVGCSLAAVMPNYVLFGLFLVLVGVAAQTFTTNNNSLVQLTTEPAMRGRVMAILMAIVMGTTPIGAPLVGFVADRFGPRWSLMVAAASGLAAALVGVAYLARHRNLRLDPASRRPRFIYDDETTEKM
ncbi:MAG TPA: MFS transporter [Caulobacteraceae bacterium]|nr:MFS transporter [Caulobacteraceae bacterium]